MAHKVKEYRNRSPPYLGNIPKKYHSFTPSLRKGISQFWPFLHKFIGGIWESYSASLCQASVVKTIVLGATDALSSPSVTLCRHPFQHHFIKNNNNSDMNNNCNQKPKYSIIIRHCIFQFSNQPHDQQNAMHCTMRLSPLKAALRKFG